MLAGAKGRSWRLHYFPPNKTSNSPPLFHLSCSPSNTHTQSQGQHDHSQDGPSEEEDLAVAFDGVWKGLTALAGIYLLFIIEHCIGMFKHYKDQGVRSTRPSCTQSVKGGTQAPQVLRSESGSSSKTPLKIFISNLLYCFWSLNT